jgi:hypothetical protein
MGLIQNSKFKIQNIWAIAKLAGCQLGFVINWVLLSEKPINLGMDVIFADAFGANRVV